VLKRDQKEKDVVDFITLEFLVFGLDMKIELVLRVAKSKKIKRPILD